MLGIKRFYDGLITITSKALNNNLKTYKKNTCNKEIELFTKRARGVFKNVHKEKSPEKIIRV